MFCSHPPEFSIHCTISFLTMELSILLIISWIRKPCSCITQASYITFANDNIENMTCQCNESSVNWCRNQSNSSSLLSSWIKSNVLNVVLKRVAIWSQVGLILINVAFSLASWFPIKYWVKTSFVVSVIFNIRNILKFGVYAYAV